MALGASNAVGLADIGRPDKLPGNTVTKPLVLFSGCDQLVIRRGDILERRNDLVNRLVVQSGTREKA